MVFVSSFLSFYTEILSDLTLENSTYHKHFDLLCQNTHIPKLKIFKNMHWHVYTDRFKFVQLLIFLSKSIYFHD